jgi:hypothetical protein
MTAKTRHRFVRVANGLWRTEDGTHHIMKTYEKVLKWRVTFINMLSVKVERKFTTLSKAKNWVNDPDRN